MKSQAGFYLLISNKLEFLGSGLSSRSGTCAPMSWAAQLGMTTWISGSCPSPWQGLGIRWFLKFPNHSVVLIQGEKSTQRNWDGKGSKQKMKSFVPFVTGQLTSNTFMGSKSDWRKQWRKNSLEWIIKVTLWWWKNEDEEIWDDQLVGTIFWKRNATPSSYFFIS